jgi:hypothetical protein
METPKNQISKAVTKSREGESLRRWATIRMEGLHELNREEVERLLAKARDSGVRALTPEERAMLDRFSTPH